MQEATAEIELMEQRHEAEMISIELKLLAAAHQVRDHAQAIDDWTDNHSEALSAVGSALLAECGWDDESVHQFMKDVVESIEGLEYGP